jgi:hypothetical protein
MISSPGKAAWLRLGRLWVFILGLGGLVTGCARKEPLENAIVAASHGHLEHASRWDKLIRELAHRYTVHLKDNRRDHESGRRAIEAVKEGCRDPFVRYLALRSRLLQSDASDEKAAREFLEIMQAMQVASYPPLLQAYVAKRGYWEWRKAFGYEKELPEVRILSDRFWNATFQSVHEPGVPEWMNRTLARELEDLWRQAKNNREYVAGRVDTDFSARYGDCATIHYLRGVRLVTAAWDARGSGYANTVTSEGWEKFGAGLESAKAELERAWQMDPKETDIAAEMITVCLGQNRPRAEMELWYQRGIATGNDATELAEKKLYYLAPRWHGSLEEQLQFARECLAHPDGGWNWSALLWKVHVDYQSILDLPVAYFGEPAVWADIHASLSRYLELNPKASYIRMRHAYHAWLAHDWPVLQRELPLTDLTKADLQKIGGRKVYDQMVSDAKDHASDPYVPSSSEASASTPVYPKGTVF